PDVHGKNERFPSQFLDLSLCAFQAVNAACDQTNPGAMLRKLSDCSASDSRRRARDDDYLITLIHLLRLALCSPLNATSPSSARVKTENTFVADQTGAS